MVIFADRRDRRLKFAAPAPSICRQLTQPIRRREFVKWLFKMTDTNEVGLRNHHDQSSNIIRLRLDKEMDNSTGIC